MNIESLNWIFSLIQHLIFYICDNFKCLQITKQDKWKVYESLDQAEQPFFLNYYDLVVQCAQTPKTILKIGKILGFFTMFLNLHMTSNSIFEQFSAWKVLFGIKDEIFQKIGPCKPIY